MVKKIAFVLGAIVLVLAAVVALQPATFSIERSTSIAAPAGVIYPHIASLRALDEWSPWAKMDANLKTVYAGPESGVGARSKWEGPEMGKGRLSIIAVKPDQEIEMKLEMVEPMQATNRILFSLVPGETATEVTWRMEGRNGFIGKAFAMLLSMDEMVGRPFEEGLAALKAVSEADAAKLAEQ
jgi:hypothetical protein